MSIAILPFLAPITLIIASVLAFRGPEFRPAGTLRITEIDRARRVGHRGLLGLPADPERSGQQRAHRRSAVSASPPGSTRSAR
jgi:hypothetical protein